VQIRDKKRSPRYERDGIVSHLLVSAWTTQSRQLTTILVEMSPGGTQHLHSYVPQQCYFILEGEGVMTVGSESHPVVSGDCVFIPSNQTHGLRNTGKSALRYFSAAAPSFGGEAELRKLWPLNPEVG
jgi:mannose-6-phosphate isomerase-like protein (cupin superfamily)